MAHPDPRMQARSRNRAGDPPLPMDLRRLSARRPAVEASSGFVGIAAAYRICLLFGADDVRMADDSGRVVWLWGPLLLVAVLVAVFRFAETGGVGSETRKSRGAPSSALPSGSSPGVAGAASVPGGETRPPGGGFAALPGYSATPYAASPAPYSAGPVCPPWAGYARPHPFPSPGDHSGRYWGSGAAEWGPPIGEYGPDTQIDPYWWVAAEEGGR